jgi:MraZ protein
MSARSSRYFRGRYEMKLDPKGRLSLPSGYLQALDKSGGLVLTNSRYLGSPCLHAFRTNEWYDLEKKIDGLSALEPSVQAFNRFYLSAGQELELDTQNRLVVPQSLRKYAGLEGSLILVGMGDKFEIWDSETWSKVFSRLTDDFENLQVQVSQLAKGDGR